MSQKDELDGLMGRLIIMDTETTGFSRDRDRIVEIGALEMVDFKLTRREFHAYINPQKTMSAEVIKIHGLTNSFLGDKPLFEDVAPAFVEFVGEAPLVAHNARFDMGFINASLVRAGRPALTNRVVDTIFMAKERLSSTRLSLDNLCDRFNVSRASRGQHGALLDARLLADVFVHLATFGHGRFDLDTSTPQRPASPTGRLLSMRAASAVCSSAIKAPQSGQLYPGAANDEELKRHRAFIEEIGAKLWLRHPS